jgi:hypothetical protein
MGAAPLKEGARISKNTILRDRVNDEQVKLAKNAPMMVRNPKKIAKQGTGASKTLLGG